LFGKPVSEDPNMPWVGDIELFTIALEGGAPHSTGLTLPEIRQIKEKYDTLRSENNA